MMAVLSCLVSSHLDWTRLDPRRRTFDRKSMEFDRFDLRDHWLAQPQQVESASCSDFIDLVPSTTVQYLRIYTYPAAH